MVPILSNDRYTYYNNVEINRYLPIGPGMVYRWEGRLCAKFAEASIGSKAFEVDVRTAELFVSAPRSSRNAEQSGREPGVGWCLPLARFAAEQCCMRACGVEECLRLGRFAALGQVSRRC